jgi:hypothetical protein
MAPSTTTAARRQSSMNQAKSLIPSPTCFSHDWLLICVRLLMGMKPSRAMLCLLLFVQCTFSSQAMSCLFLIACTVRPATRVIGLHPISALYDFRAEPIALVFSQWLLHYPGSVCFSWNLDSSIRLCNYACMRPSSVCNGLRQSGIRCLA